MDSTDRSLLNRVRNRRDRESWREFFDLYFPLLVRYARSRNLGPADADDVAQECMRKLTRQMERFEYQPHRGRFRSYLRKLANDVIVDMHRRRRPRLAGSDELAPMEQADSRNDVLWDKTWFETHVRHCLQRLEHRFSPRTIQAFTMYALQGRPLEEVCRRLDVSADQVYQAKTRVTRRLREEIQRLVGDID